MRDGEGRLAAAPAQPAHETETVARPPARFDRDAYQRALLSERAQRIRLLEAEERRLYRLLALALRVATRDGRDCDPYVLLEVLCAVDGTDPARPAWVEEREQAETAAELERLAQLLRETDPARTREKTRAA